MGVGSSSTPAIALSLGVGSSSNSTVAMAGVQRRWVLLLSACSFFGCVNLDAPWASVAPDASDVVSTAGTSAPSTGIRGAGGVSGGPDTAEAAGGARGTDGPDLAGGSSGGTVLDSGAMGLGGNATASGGNAGADAQGGPDQPQAAGGLGPDAGAGGSALGGAGGVAGAVGAGGAGGQFGGGGTSRGDVPDAFSSYDSTSSDGPCVLCSMATSLVHRYNFGGTGTNVHDSVGTADGTVVNAQLSGSGTLVLAGGSSGQYVALPAHILSTLTSATLEIWVTWTGGSNNQRILDFGSNELVDGNYRATTTVIISPDSAPDALTPRLRASYSNQVSLSGTFVDATSALPTGSMKQIAVVFDGQRHTISMYLNGKLQGETAGLGALSLINDTNNWLGKSQYSGDPAFAGIYHEFRIYDAPLTADQIQAVYVAGTNASFSP
jgi:hypothetical protein